MHKTIAIASLTVLIGLVNGLGCQHAKPPAAAAPPPPEPATPFFVKDTTGRVIVHVVSRHETITVKSGDHGVTYTVMGRDGTMILADATDAEFEKANPQLYQQIRHYIAVQADSAHAIQAADMPSAPDASVIRP
jgi:hypothetical protein